MNEFDKKYFDLDYLFMRDRLISFLLDNDRFYSLYDSKMIRKLLKLLLKHLEKGYYNER